MFEQNPRCRAVLVYAALGAFALWASNARADELHVPGQYDTIQAAIDASSVGDVIIVAEGTYTGDGNRDIRFGGRAITVRSTDPQDPAVVAATIIDTESTEDDHHSGFVLIDDEPPDAVVDGLTITNTLEGPGSAVICDLGAPTVRNCVITGHKRSGIGCSGRDSSPTIMSCTIASNSAEEAGGGIYCGWFARPTILNCLIANNSAEEAGGGICCEWFASPTIQDCTITQNYVPPVYWNFNRGGGICSHHARPTIIDCVIADNTADGSLGLGGGICCDERGRAVISNCTITGNSAGYGGGVYFREVRRWSLTDCTITDNTAAYNDGGGVSCLGTEDSGRIADCTITDNSAALTGGGIRIWWDSVHIIGCTVADNSAGESGGGISCYDGDTTIQTCTITGNHAALFGGGVRCYLYTEATIIDCTIGSNTAGESGGGISSRFYGNPTIENCTITGNTAVQSGGNCYAGSYDSHATLGNSILRNGQAPAGPEIAVVAEDGYGEFTTTVRYCNVQGGFEAVLVSEGCTLDWGEGNIDLPPLFVDADGPDDDPNTWEDNDHHLADSSPCIDAGDPDYAPRPFETDIDGQVRLWDGDDDGIARIDMGSDEAGAWCFGDLNGDGVIDMTDLAVLLASYGAAEGMEYTDGDFDYDGDVDLADLAELLGRYGGSCM